MTQSTDPHHGLVDNTTSSLEGTPDEPSDQAERKSTGGGVFTLENQIQRTNLLLLAASAA
ncbi:hypothetical protein F5Y16DRAFT_406487 [Xylariaceae sp. FL0255]|nr:hypothetical protein F5Y16DRAFT_406487 [Xylariaceae sp. FL0255]